MKGKSIEPNHTVKVFMLLGFFLVTSFTNFAHNIKRMMTEEIQK
jgi:hypothetical protein